MSYNSYIMNGNARGTTLIEILIGITLVVIVAGIGIVVFNPAGQLARARNSERELHLQAIINSIRQNIADQSGGSFSCASGALPTSSKKMAIGGGNYDIAPCIVPTYLPVMPHDPTAAGGHYSSNTDYDTGYFVLQNATTGQVTVTAPSAELGVTISITR